MTRRNLKDMKRPIKKAADKKISAKKTLQKKGAVRSSTDSNGSKQIKWGRFVLIAVLFTASVAGLTQVKWQEIYQKTYQATNRPLASIKISGQFRFVSRVELEELISSQLDGSFVDLNLQEVKSAIENNPWIESVLVERIWPDSLKLKIEEHYPIARWNDDGFINRAGRLIKVESNEVLVDLPLLSGKDENSNELSKNYFFFSESLKRSGLKISALSVDNKMSWSLYLEQGFELVFGREDIQSKLENFKFVFETHLGKKINQIDRVDLRYEKGLAVKWKESSEFVAVSPGQ